MIEIPYLSKARGLRPGVGAVLRVDPRSRHLICVHPDGAETDLESIPRWGDLSVPLEMAQPSATPPTYGAFRGEAYAWMFDSTTEQHLRFCCQMPHGWAFSTTIKPHIHIGFPAATVNGKTIRFVLDYTVQTPNAGIFPALTTIGATYTINTALAQDAQYGHAKLALPDIAMAGHTASAILLCRLYRDPSVDDYAADVACFDFGLHYQIDALGTTGVSTGK